MVRLTAALLCISAGFAASVNPDTAAVVLLLAGVALMTAMLLQPRNSPTPEIHTHVSGGIDDPWSGPSVIEPLRGTVRLVLLSQPRR